MAHLTGCILRRKLNKLPDRPIPPSSLAPHEPEYRRTGERKGTFLHNQSRLAGVKCILAYLCVPHMLHSGDAMVEDGTFHHPSSWSCVTTRGVKLEKLSPENLVFLHGDVINLIFFFKALSLLRSGITVLVFQGKGKVALPPEHIF